MSTVEDLLHEFGVTYNVLTKEERLSDTAKAKQLIHQLLRDKLPKKRGDKVAAGTMVDVEGKTFQTLLEDTTPEERSYNQAIDEVEAMLDRIFK